VIAASVVSGEPIAASAIERYNREAHGDPATAGRLSIRVAVSRP
jgi:hypothetical protein